MPRHTQLISGRLWSTSSLWLLAFAFCLSGWALLSESEQGRRALRVTRAGELASAELAASLQRRDTPALGPQVRALLVRRDIGFAWLRVRDDQGRAVASAGRLESGTTAGLPAGLRRRLYGLTSTEHRVALVHNDAEVGRLEFGLLIIGGRLEGAAGGLLAGLLLLGLGLPALGVLSLRLRRVFLADWSAGGVAAAREATVSMLDTGVRPGPAPVPPAPAVPAGAQELLKVFERGAIVVDRHQAVLDLNPLAAELTGWTPEQARGRPLSEVLRLFQTDLRSPVSLPLEACFAGERERMQAHYYLRRRDDTLHEVEIDAGPLREATGLVTGVLLSISQVAKSAGMLQRIVPGQALVTPQDRQQLSQMLLDQVLECVVTTDSQDRIQFANGRALEAFGYTLTELRGEHISRLLPVPFLRKTQLRIADFALTLPGMPDAEVVAQRRDGSQIPARLVIHPVSLRDRQGHVVTVRPVRPQTTGTVVRLGPRLRHLLGSLTDEVYVADPDSLKLIATNPQARENLGYTAEQLGQMMLPRLCPRLTPETLRSHVARLREGATDIVEFRSWHQRANGSGYEVNSRLSLWTGEGPPVLLVVAQAVAAGVARPDAMLREDRIDFLATHDALTGLPSRPLFMQRLHQAIAAYTDNHQPFAVVHLALSGFGDINQEYGYETGDRVLKAVSDRLSVAVRSADSVARLGGDEFVLLMGGIQQRADASGLLRRVQQALSPPLRVGQQEFRIQAGLGAAVYPDDAPTPEQLLRCAGLALRAARAQGAGQARLYKPAEVPAAAAESIEPVEQLREAQIRGELAIELQPLHDVRARRVIGAEVLMAWHHPERGLLRTAEQLRQAGGSAAQAGDLGTWALEQACEQQANWRNLELHSLPLLVNLSALPLSGRRAAQSLRGMLARCRVPPEQLIAMINATELEELLLDAGSWLPVLRDLGLRIGVNDVDPGRMELLRHADTDVVRLTPRAIAGLPGSPDAVDQTEAIIQAAQRLGARVFASGIERPEQREALLALGCHVQQGRLLGAPQDPREFARMLVRSEAGAF